jgi:hypothetical protein
MGQQWSNIFPPPPTLTEKNLPDQSGKVGASSDGITFGLADLNGIPARRRRIEEIREK